MKGGKEVSSYGRVGSRKGCRQGTGPRTEDCCSGCSRRRKQCRRRTRRLAV